MNEYSRKMLRIPTYNLLREQDMGKLPVLDVRNLGIDFGGLTAVDGFNITIGPTEISGLIGPNGAGKTTIFNLLTKVYQPTRGNIMVNGFSTAGKSTHQISRMGIARTFQNIRLFNDMTALDNVKVGMHKDIKCSFVSSVLRLPPYFKAEMEADKKAMELALIGGESYLKPVIGDEITWRAVSRGDILVFARDADGNPTDVGLMEKSRWGRHWYTLLERRTLDESGFLSVSNRLFRGTNQNEPGREVSQKSLPCSAASSAVIRAPLFPGASTTRTPQLRPLMIRFLLGKFRARGGVPGGNSERMQP